MIATARHIIVGAAGAGAIATVEVQLTMNGQQFVPLGLSGEGFSYYDQPGVHGISPSGGPLEGGTRVEIRGNWSVATMVSEQLRRRFGMEKVKATRDMESGMLVCFAPRVPRPSTRPIWCRC